MRGLIASLERVIESEISALTAPYGPGMPDAAARCSIVAGDLRLLLAELREARARLDNPPGAFGHSTRCARDEDGVVEVCDPDCPRLRDAEGIF